MEEATFLTKFADKVTVVHRRDELRASKIMQEKARQNPKIAWLWDSVIVARQNPKIAWLWDSVIVQVLGGPGQGVTGAKVRNVKTNEVSEVSAEGIFMAIGHVPNTTLFRDQLDMDDNGYLVVDGETTATSVPGVFAAGDVADHRYRQAITAAGSGCPQPLRSPQGWSGGPPTASTELMRL